MTTATQTQQTLTVNRLEMLAGFGAVSGACPSRSPKEILKSVMLEVSAGRATLLATDLEIGIRYRIPGVVVDGDEDAKVVLPTEKIRQILGDSEDETIRLVLEGEPGGKPDHVLVRGARFKHRLPLQDADLFPAVADFGDDVADYVSIQAPDLRRAIRRSIFATDEATTRYALAGCLFEFDGENLGVVATDSRRLSKQAMTVEVEGAGFTRPETERFTVVPVKTLRLLQRVTGDDDFPIHLAHATPPDNGVMFRTERAVIYSRLVEGRYPDYRMIIPATHATKVVVPVGPLLEGVKQASNATSTESRSVECVFSGETLLLKAAAADVGEGEAEVPVAIDGPEADVMMDSRYFLDVLKSLDPDLSLRIGVEDYRKALLIAADDGFTHVLMPLTKSE